MEFRFRAIDERPSTYVPCPSSSNVGYFTEQARRVGYLGPNFGNTTDFYGNPNPRRPMHEAVQRELERERIREEIIRDEMTRRRVLEEEVRREMMIGQMALRRGGGGSIFPGFEPRVSILQHQLEGRSFEERIVTLLEERLRDGGRRGGIGGGFEAMPFQRMAEPKIAEVKSTAEVCKEKVIFLAKPEGNSSGEKRKAVTPPAAGATEPPSVGPKKKRKEEWSCAICQVSVTNEQGLNEHLRGKKHKSKEAGLRQQKAGKNYAIGLFPKKTAKPIKLVEPTTMEDLDVLEKSKMEDLKPNNDLAAVVFQGSSGLKNKKGDSSEKMLENDGDLKKKKKKKENFKFWCEMCQVGALSEKVMNRHKNGKKHVGRLERLEKKSKSEVAAKANEAPQKESEPKVGPKNNEETLENESLEGSASLEVEEKQEAGSD